MLPTLNIYRYKKKLYSLNVWEITEINEIPHNNRK